MPHQFNLLLVFLEYQYSPSKVFSAISLFYIAIALINFFYIFADLYIKTFGFHSFYTSPAIGLSFLPLLNIYNPIGFCLLSFLILFSPACLLTPVDSFLFSIYIHNDPFFPLFSFILFPILKVLPFCILVYQYCSDLVNLISHLWHFLKYTYFSFTDETASLFSTVTFVSVHTLFCILYSKSF